MPTIGTEVRLLLGAVRRVLWRDQLFLAIRRALWGTAGLMLLALAVHLLVRSVSFSAVLWALAVLWPLVLVWVGWRRPSESACALWADRRLGGASAFTTLLDLGQGPPGRADARALQRLDDWAKAKVPQGLRLLREQGHRPGLSRALPCALVCTALAAFVLALPDPGSAAAPGRPAAAPPSITIDRPAPLAQAPASSPWVGQMASALRAAASRNRPDRAEAGPSPTREPGQAGSLETPVTAQAGTRSAGSQGAVGAPGPAQATDSPAAAGAAQAAGAGGGRQAGDSADDRANGGVSRGAQGTMSMQKFEGAAGRTSARWQADMEQLAAYDDELAANEGARMRALAVPAAAAAPAITDSARLTPTEATYVQAWLKASTRPR